MRPEPFLLQPVLQPVHRQKKLRSGRYCKAWLRDPFFTQHFKLCKQHFRIQCDAACDHVHNLRVEYARRQKMQHVLSVRIDDRVSGIRTALKADDGIRLTGQQICNLALSLVAPAAANNRSDHKKPSVF